MCLAIPGRVIETFDRKGIRMARVQFGGVVRQACLQAVPEAEVGSYVLVHVGFALAVIDEEEAARTFALFEEMGALAELDPPQPDGRPGTGDGEP